MAETREMPTASGPLAGDREPVFEILRTTKAMRRLDTRPVSRELLLQVVEAATWGPSGGNAQDTSFTIVDDRETIARIAPLWRRAVEYYTNMKRVAPTHDDTGAWERSLAAIRYQAEHFEDIPAIIVVGFETSPTKARMDKRQMLRGLIRLGPRHGARLFGNMAKFLGRGEAACVYPSVQNMLLAARSLGLGAVMTTWHLWFEQELKEILGMPKNVHTFALVPIGYPKGKFGPVKRKPVEEFVHWNRW